jgi:hypothetical protein
MIGRRSRKTKGPCYYCQPLGSLGSTSSGSWVHQGRTARPGSRNCHSAHATTMPFQGERIGPPSLNNDLIYSAISSSAFRRVCTAKNTDFKSEWSRTTNCSTLSTFPPFFRRQTTTSCSPRSPPREDAYPRKSRRPSAAVTCSLYLARHTSSTLSAALLSHSCHYPILRATSLHCFIASILRHALAGPTCQPMPTCLSHAIWPWTFLKAAIWCHTGDTPTSHCPVRATQALAGTSMAFTSRTICR